VTAVNGRLAATVTEMITGRVDHFGVWSVEAVLSRSGKPPVVRTLELQLPIACLSIQQSQNRQSCFVSTPVLVSVPNSSLPEADEKGYKRLSTRPDPDLADHSIVQFADEENLSANGLDILEVLRFKGDISAVHEWSDSPDKKRRPKGMKNSDLVNVTWVSGASTWEHRSLPDMLLSIPKSQKLAREGNTPSATVRKCKSKVPSGSC